MGIIRVLLILVEVVCCLLLVGVILLQKSKSEGLGLAFGSGMGETLFGSRAGNVLTKITVTLALVFLVNTAILGMLFTRAHDASIIDERTAPLPMSGPMSGPVGQQAPAGEPGVAPPSAAPASTLIPGSMPEDQAPAAAPSAPAPAEQPSP